MMMERRERADCTVSALACVAGIPYEQAHRMAAQAGRRKSARFVSKKLIAEAKANGLTLRKMRFSRRRTLAKFIRENPVGRFYVQKSGHAFTVIDGVVGDNTPLTVLVTAAWQMQ